jgi:predicted nucleic acid-binding protein
MCYGTSRNLPGDLGNDPAWSGQALVVDTSAWMRADHPSVIDHWNRGLRAGLLRIAPVTSLEILFTARDGTHFDSLAEKLSALRPTQLTTSIAHGAQDVMRTLAHRSHGAHRIPIVDYLVAATAQESGAAVLHYDHDYDTLAEVMGFESIWLAPPGSMP